MVQSLGIGERGPASTAKDEWLTPPDLLKRLGSFDLDPCAPVSPPWPTALEHYSDGGLEREWHGRVWMNPPYKDARTWMARMAQHGRGMALVFARTETRAWHESIWPKARSILFIKGRLSFYHVTGEKASSCAGAPSALIGYGESLEYLSDLGALVEWNDR